MSLYDSAAHWFCYAVPAQLRTDDIQATTDTMLFWGSTSKGERGGKLLHNAGRGQIVRLIGVYRNKLFPHPGDYFHVDCDIAEDSVFVHRSTLAKLQEMLGGELEVLIKDTP